MSDAGQAGATPELWITVTVCAHFIAIGFLVRAWTLTHPNRWTFYFRKSGHTKSDINPLRDQLQESLSGSKTAGAIHVSQPQLEAAHLQWQNLGCTYQTASGARVVLQGGWGSVGPGDMVALLGPSGSGKSTLLDMLALRKTTGTLTGHMELNHKQYNLKTSGHLIAYVPQEDVLPPTLTCEEQMMFWASLLLPAGTPKEQRRQSVDQVLAAVGLQGQAHTLVGGALPGGLTLRGLSGGELKRLAVASGLLKRPPLLFLDEPTTGLDSSTALTVMQYLAALAAEGRTIIASIHQPRGAVWTLFNQGRMMYSGARYGLVPWLSESLSYGPYCPVRHGVSSDWVMDLVNIGFKKPQRYYGRSMHSIADLDAAAAAFLLKYQEAIASSAAEAGSAPVQPKVWSTQLHQEDGRCGAVRSQASAGTDGVVHSQAQMPLGEKAPAALKGGEQATHAGEADSKRFRPVGWGQQVMTLAWRDALLLTRDPGDVAGRTLLFSWVALIIGFVYYPRGSPLSRIRYNASSLIMECLALNLLPFVYMSLQTAEKRLFIADAATGLYHPSAYYAAKLIVGLPFAIVNILTLTLTMYGLLGLSMRSTASNWGPPLAEHVVVTTLGYLIANQVIRVAALLTPNQDAAFLVAIAWMAVNIILSNTIVLFKLMTMQWVPYLRFISAMWYTFNGMTRAQFEGSTYSCAQGLASPAVAQHMLPDLLPNIQNQILKPGGTDGVCVVPGSAVVDYLGPTMPSWLTCVCLVAYLLILHVVAYGALLATLRRGKR